MKDEGKTRKRAVRLKQPALEDLKAALHEHWHQEHGKSKFTRERRAALMGVSIVTADRILKGRGTDRPTLTLVCKNLGIPWSDALCEELPAPAKGEPEGDSAAESSLDLPHRKRWLGMGWRRLALGGAALVAVSIYLSQSLIPESNYEEPWRAEFHQILAKGSTNYHNGRFGLARIQIAEAIAIAQEHDAARNLASAMRMAGDLEAAQGNVQAALNQYEAVLQLQSTFLDSRSEPALLEAIGSTEIRLGNLDNAREHLTRARDLYQGYGEPVGVAMAVRDLGTIKFHEKDYAGAKVQFNLARTAIQGLNKPDIETDLTACEALVLRETGNVDASRKLLEKCLAYWRARTHQRWIATTQFQLATVEAMAGNATLAHDLLLESIRGFEEVGDVAGVEECQVWADRIAFGGHPSSRSTMRAEADVSD